MGKDRVRVEVGLPLVEEEIVISNVNRSSVRCYYLAGYG